jgi:hypothetical protein
MHTDAMPVGPDAASIRAGRIALALGIACALATVFVYALSLGEEFNPPNWVRILGLVWLPVAG